MNPRGSAGPARLPDRRRVLVPAGSSHLQLGVGWASGGHCHAPTLSPQPSALSPQPAGMGGHTVLQTQGILTGKLHTVHMLTSHWSECGHMAIPTAREAWEM